MSSKMSGQSVMDRMTAARHTIAGQGLAKTVCKATTEEVMGPKRKHLDYLLQCTNEPNVSIPQLADLLIERTQQQSWVIVFKSLVTIHNLMNYGNERFTQYLASNNCSFNLANFVDKQGVQGYDMSTFIRRYAKYLNEKSITYRQMAFDFCKVNRGRDNGLLRTMNTEKLLKTLPPLQKQIDALLEFDCTSNELNNGVINACFMLLFKDLIRLFACYNDGTINLLEKFFDMNKKQCKEALDLYKKFLVRMDKVSEFLKVAENVGIDKGDIPDLAKGLVGKSDNAPASLLDALEEHLKSLDGKKGQGTVAPPPKPSGFNTAVNTMANNSSINVSDEERRKIIEEESKQLQQLKETRPEPPVVDLLADEPQDQKQKDVGASPSQQPAAPAASSTSNNPFSSAPPTQTTPAKASDDLLNLDENPFVENVKNVMHMTSATQAFGSPSWGAPTMASPGGFPDNNFANFSNGTSGTPVASLDLSTTTTSALKTSPTTVPSVTEPLTFDPYGALVEMGDSEVKGEGQSGLLTTQGQEEPPQGLGAQSPAKPRSVSPAIDILSGDPFPASQSAAPDLFGTGQSGSSDLFGTSPSGGGDPFGGGQSSELDIFSTPKPAVSGDLFSTNRPASADLFATGPCSTAPPVTNVHTSGMDLFSSVPVGGAPSDSLDPLAGGGLDAGKPGSTDLFPSTGPFAASSGTAESDLTAFDGFGEVLQPASNQQQQVASQPQQGMNPKDLDSNLALLAGNISLNGAASVKKAQHQWEPKGEAKKTGGNNWAPNQFSQATTWSQPTFQNTVPVMGGGGGYAAQPGMAPMMGAGMGAPMGGAPMMGGGPGMMGGMPVSTMGQMPGMPMAGGAPMYNMGGVGAVRPPMGGMGMAPMGMGPGGMMGGARPPVTQNQPNDPFGAL